MNRRFPNTPITADPFWRDAISRWCYQIVTPLGVTLTWPTTMPFDVRVEGDVRVVAPPDVEAKE